MSSTSVWPTSSPRTDEDRDARRHLLKTRTLSSAQPLQLELLTLFYDRMNLVLAIRTAADAFHEAWRTRLGLEFKPGFAREHWTRVKALSRRLATGMKDEYDTLRPIADLRKELVERIYVFVQQPLRWEGPAPSDDQKQASFDAFADDLSLRLLELCTLAGCGTNALRNGRTPTTSTEPARHSCARGSSATRSTSRRHPFQTSRLPPTATSSCAKSSLR